MRDHVVIVTGGGRGIGRAVCLCFARAGAHVVAAARSIDQVRETAELCREDGGTCTPMQIDVASVEQIERMVADTHKLKGRIDVLINNAGSVIAAPADQIAADEFDRLMCVNVAAVFHASKAVVPIMAEQGGGVIVNISSVAAADPFPGLATYGAAKAWVNAFTKGMAAECASKGVRVMAVAPGAVETNMLRSILPDFPADDALSPDAVADVVFELTQPGFVHVNGQCVYVRK